MTELNPLALALPGARVDAQAGAATKGLADNFEMFLTLLTEQLRNQDPLSPMDSQEFVGQLVQFTAVEQQISTNQSLEGLLALQAASARMSATDFLGREVTASTPLNSLENGSARWNYTLPRTAQSTELVISDQAGRVITTLPGETDEGAHAFVWNGRDIQGNTLPDGIYSLEVVSRDANGQRIDAPTRVTARVTGVDMSSDEVFVELGALTLPAGRVIHVREPGT